MIIHHVFFWLKNPASKEDVEKLITGLRTLRSITTIKQMHIGVPATTEQRSVVDGSYNVSELLFFENLAGQEVYQSHPMHQKFIDDYSQLWKKVVVYDVAEVDHH